MRKQKNIEKVEDTKKSRAKHKCLPELSEILIMVNAVPPNAEIAPARDIKSRLEAEYLLKYNVNRVADLDLSARVEMWFDVADICYKDFYDQNYKKNVFQYWFDRLRDDLDKLERTDRALFYSVFETYEYFRKVRYDVGKIIKYVAEFKSQSPILWLYDTDLHTPTTIRQDKGEIRMSLLGFSQIIEKIDLERLRRCMICDKVFWAENKQSFTCSENCRSALRQRKYREKNKEEVNRKRREYYQTAKKLKANKEKSDGTL